MLTPLLVICSASMLTAGPPQLIFKILSGCQWLNSYILETIIKNFLAFPFPFSVSITVQSSSTSCTCLRREVFLCIMSTGLRVSTLLLVWDMAAWSQHRENLFPCTQDQKRKKPDFLFSCLAFVPSILSCICLFMLLIGFCILLY